MEGVLSNDVIAEQLHKIHDEFGLVGDKLTATVTDNGSNFVAAFKNFGASVEDTFFYGTYNI